MGGLLFFLICLWLYYKVVWGFRVVFVVHLKVFCCCIVGV